MAAVVLSVAIGLVCAPQPASSQAAQAPPPAPPPVVQAAPEAPEPNRPGFIDEVGKLFGNPSFGLPKLKSPQQTLEDFNNSARETGNNLSRLSKGEVVAGRVKCPTAANGAPDCKSAAMKLCLDKGYKEGQSVDSDSAEDCPASVLLSGKPDGAQSGAPACRIENYVIRALCQ